MTKNEALEAMISGKKVKHYYYTPEEFVFINSQSDFETEDGCKHGGMFDEFWAIYQKWEDGWEIFEEPINEII